MAHFTVVGNPIAARPLQNGLYLVATPIGNLGDITLRALETLAAADLIACEDTRVTAKLLRHFSIATPMTSYHEHNASRAGPRLIERLRLGASIALVSDAGSPLISDPGIRLVESAHEAAIPVHPIPGPSAPVAAITASGLAGTAYLFAGFLPTRAKARRDRLAVLAAIPAALVLFESPNRLCAALRDIGEVLGAGRQICVAREITKLHEEFRKGTATMLLDHYASSGVRGEVVLVVAAPQAAETEPDLDGVLKRLMKSETVSRAAMLAASETGISRKTVYARALQLSEKATTGRR